jgi:hypothetical protein
MIKLTWFFCRVVCHAAVSGQMETALIERAGAHRFKSLKTLLSQNVYGLLALIPLFN